MGKRELEIVLVSAQSLTRQCPPSGMVVSAKAYISSNPESAQWTRADLTGDVNPNWNHAFRFTLKYNSFSRCGDYLNIELYNVPDRVSWYYVDRVQIPLINWIEFAGNPATPGWVPISYRLNTGGILHLFYRLGAYKSRTSAILNNPLGKVVTTLVTGVAVSLITS